MIVEMKKPIKHMQLLILLLAHLPMMLVEKIVKKNNEVHVTTNIIASTPVDVRASISPRKLEKRKIEKLKSQVGGPRLCKSFFF
jgi:hypothetical protein